MSAPTQLAPCDLLITHASVLTLDDQWRILDDGAVATRGREIVAVGPTAELASAFAPVRTIDGRGRVVAPGLIDSHVHPSRYVVGGRPYRQAGQPALLAHGGQVEAFAAELAAVNAARPDPDLIHATTLPLLASLIRSGTTAFLDAGGNDVEGVARAVLEVGIRATLSPNVCDLAPERDEPGASPLRTRDTDTLLRYVDDGVRRWHGAAEGRIQAFASGVWGLNGSDALLGGLAAIARSRGVGMHLHVAGVAAEDAVSERWHGRRTIPRLAALGVLGPHFVAMHAYFATDEDVRLLAEAGAAANQAPFASALVGRGIGAACSLPRLRAAGIPLGLGSDTTGLAVSMFNLIRAALTVYRDATQDDLALSLEDALRMATRGSARCLLREPELGAITPGRLADLVVVDLSGPRFALQSHPAPALALLASPADVETVIVDGRVILDRGHLTTIDEERMVAEARAAARRFATAQ